MLLHQLLSLVLLVFGAAPSLARKSSRKHPVRKSLPLKVSFKDLIASSQPSTLSSAHLIYPSSSVKSHLYAVQIRSISQGLANFAKSAVMALLFESMTEELKLEKYKKEQAAKKKEKTKWYQRWFQRKPKTVEPPKPVFSNAQWSSQQTLIEETLASHNYHRQMTGSPPLKWDETLHAHAQTWANHLAAKGFIFHDTITRPNNEGENIGINWGTTTTPLSTVIDRWVNEREIYRNRRGKQRILGYHNYPQVGHWVQVVWRSTTRVGCAYQISHVHQCIVWVCRYRDIATAIGKTMDGYAY